MNPMAKALHAALLAAFLAVAPIGNGQQPQNAALSPLAFLTGRWMSEERTEVQEENWSPVIGNSMTGSFRIVQSGRPVFYEFWAVELDENRPVLKLKHFNADLAGWEEKNASTKMPLVSNAEDDAVFAEPPANGCCRGLSRLRSSWSRSIPPSSTPRCPRSRQRSMLLLSA
jgi:hypothetical protein